MEHMGLFVNLKGYEEIDELDQNLKLLKQIREVVTKHSVAPSTQMMRYKKIQRLIYG